MCHRPTICSLNPFSPYRHDVAGRVVHAMDLIRIAHRYGHDGVEELLAEHDSHWIRAHLALALRHLSVDEGGECIDQSRRKRGRLYRGSLAKRVARRVHRRPELVHALMDLLLLRIPDSVWGMFEKRLMDPVLFWRSLVRDARFREIVARWTEAGPDARVPRAFVCALLNNGELPLGWAARGGAYWYDEAPRGCNWAPGWC